MRDLTYDDIKLLDTDIQHLEDTLADPEKDWSCEECKQDHIRLLRWLRMLRTLMDKALCYGRERGVIWKC